MLSRTIKMLLMLLLTGSLAYAADAEIYRWEDANGTNFTDDSSSVPEKYRERFFAEANTQPEIIAPRVKTVVYRQNIPDVFQENRTAVRQANLEQKRRSAESAKQEQMHTMDFQNTLQSLVFCVEILVMLGFVLFVIWMVTIADIFRSEFITPTNKTAWLLLVLLLPVIGMLPYMILGANYKCNPVRRIEKQRLALVAD